MTGDRPQRYRWQKRYCNKMDEARPGNLEIWESWDRKEKKYKLSKSKSVSPKMLARSGLVGKNPPGPMSCHFKQFSAWAGNTEKIHNFCIVSLVGPWAPIHPVWVWDHSFMNEMRNPHLERCFRFMMAGAQLVGFIDSFSWLLVA